MFNWQKMCSDKTKFPELYEELRRGKGLYILEEVRMPEICGNKICTIEFRYYGDDLIMMTCREVPIPYSGTDNEIEKWLRNGTATFQSFDEMGNFLEKFGRTPFHYSETRDTVHKENIPSPKMEYDREKLAVPPKNSSCIILDKQKLTAELNQEILGQEENIEKIVHLICSHLGTKNKIRPLSVFLYGPPGTGKSSVVEQLTEKINCQLSNDSQFFYRPIDCSQFQERADISKLIGAAPGYVGYDEPGVFSVVEDHPHTIFVFEEIEKAASNAAEVIMQAMETGRQDTNGKILHNGKSYYDLSDSVIFFTSNIDTEEKKLGFNDSPMPSKKDACKNIAAKIGHETKEEKIKLLKTGKFKREVISRITAVIRFNTISGDIIKDIAAKSIKDTAEKYHRLYITKLGTPILQEFINETSGEVENFGVRSLRHEAEYYFNDAFREYSQRHDDYSKISVSGTLDSIKISPG